MTKVVDGTNSDPRAETLLHTTCRSTEAALKHSRTLVKLATVLVWHHNMLERQTDSPTSVMRLQGRATQTLAKWSVGMDQPEIMRQAGCRCVEVDLTIRLFAFPFAGQLRFVSVQDFENWMSMKVTFCLASTFPLPDSCKRYYQPHGSINFRIDSYNKLYVSEGCYVEVRSVQCARLYKQYEQHAFQLCDRDGTKLTSRPDPITMAQGILRKDLELPDSSVETANWFLQKVREDATFLTIQPCTGLTHPVAPFLRSSNTIIYDDPVVVAEWEQIAFGGPGNGRGAVIPYTMPPALSDIDEQLQQAYLSGARMGIEDASPEILAATDAALREQLEGNTEALGDCNECDILDVIGNAKSLVREALVALHAVEYRKRILETVARQAVLDAANAAVAEAVYKEGLRDEWRKREHWVRKEAQQCQGPKKGRNRQRKVQQPQLVESQTLKHSLERAVENVERRSWHYKLAGKSITALEHNGFLRRSVADTTEKTRMKIARQQLALDDGPESLFDGEVVELVVPKRAHHLCSSIPADASGGPRRPITQRQALSVFDAAKERNADLRTAHADEIALKVGIQISLAEHEHLHENSTPSSSSHDGPVVEDGASAEDAASRSSQVSWVHAAGGDDCFVPGTLFQLASGLLVPVQQLEEGSTVCGSNGVVLQVIRFRHHERQQVQLMDLRTDHARILVTASHRIVVHRPQNSTSINSGVAFAAANALGVGQHVVISDGVPAALIHAQMFSGDTDFFQITFEPDEPVEVYVVPSQRILSLGEQRRPQSRTRRSGMAQRQRTRIADIPATDDGYG